MTAPQWNKWKLAHAYPRIGSGTTPTSTQDSYYVNGADEDGIPWITTAELRENYIEKTVNCVTAEALKDFSALRLFKAGSLFVAMYGATIGRLGITIIPATCNQACCVFEESAQFDNRFLFYWLWHRRSDLIALSTGGGQPNLSQRDLREERALCPPLETQRRIARFLDEKTARIDALIEKKRTLLDLLAEKRQALITRAVTKGLDPTAPMKPSGIDWLGDIPAHWEVLPLSFVAEVVDCKHRTPEYIDSGIPLVSTTEIKPFFIDYSTKRKVSEREFFLMSEGGRKPKCGDVIYSRNASVGSAALVRLSADLCLGQDLCIIRPNSVDPEFLEYFLNSKVALEQLNGYLVGATFKRINVEFIKKYFMIHPPIHEQRKIVSWLSERFAVEETSSKKVVRSVELLDDYRAALITSAVTGKIAELQ